MIPRGARPTTAKRRVAGQLRIGSVVRRGVPLVIFVEPSRSLHGRPFLAVGLARTRQRRKVSLSVSVRSPMVRPRST